MHPNKLPNATWRLKNFLFSFFLQLCHWGEESDMQWVEHRARDGNTTDLHVGMTAIQIKTKVFVIHEPGKQSAPILRELQRHPQFF